MPASAIQFFERTFPSANMVLLHGAHPILVDTGFGSDITETEALLSESGVRPIALSLIVNTHYHSDHVGGNHVLQEKYGIPIAAHRWDAEMINNRDYDACGAEWLDQPIEPYTVQHMLSDEDILDTGSVLVHVLHTPGHTLGHIALYAPEEKTLLCGDLFHRSDVGWINRFREGAGAIQRSLLSLERLASLPIERAYSGHGSAIEDPMRSLDAARRRLESWLTTPERIGWHACKRVFAYALMIFDGMHEDEVSDYLLSCAWFHDFSRHIFQAEPRDFVAPLLAEMIRSGAAIQEGRRILAGAAYTPPASNWLTSPARPNAWPNATPFSQQP
ncbi:MBL fold metallo-hydrolase [Aneurinibacillus sp. REN35]|uniref:MBL fold metallo-hydrolase n=1 Tax=Aneurinibacillus sp. REN35 TaxID=3237286 RepID=UPI00352942B9